jgi:hypothetical protein
VLLVVGLVVMFWDKLTGSKEEENEEKGSTRGMGSG